MTQAHDTRLLDGEAARNPEVASLVRKYREALTSSGTPVSLILESAGSRRIQVIREVRSMTGLGLSEASRLVAHPPAVVLSDTTPEAAAAWAVRLRAAGAVVRQE